VIVSSEKLSSLGRIALWRVDILASVDPFRLCSFRTIVGTFKIVYLVVGNLCSVACVGRTLSNCRHITSDRENCC